jgi:hypothetical protein
MTTNDYKCNYYFEFEIWNLKHFNL